MKKVNRNNKKIIADILYRCIKSGKANFKELADKISCNSGNEGHAEDHQLETLRSDVT